MDKMSYPRGLIRFATQNGLAQKLDHKQTLRRVLRPRVLIYTTILLVICTAFVTSLALRSPFRVDVVRDRGTLARMVGAGNIENVYRMQVMNATESPQRYRVRVEGLVSAVVEAKTDFTVGPADARWLPVEVQIGPQAAEQLGAGAHPLTFVIEREAAPGVAAAQVREKSTFIVPR